MDFLKSIVDFIIVAVILKVIIAHWLAERILSFSKELFHSTDRNLAIWMHYKEGHLTSSVLRCVDGKCTIFHA